MSITIGRMNVASPLWVPEGLSAKGEQFTVNGHVGSDENVARAARQQILGHIGEVVPVVSSDDSSLTGYYRVLDGTVGLDALDEFSVSVDLERADNYAALMFESQLIGADLANGLGVVGAAWHALPQSATDRSRPNLTDAVNRSSADGSMTLFFHSAYETYPRFRLAPASYYVGAARLEISDDLGTQHVVTGNQVANKPFGWRLSNGVVRVSPELDADAGLVVEHWDGSEWDTGKEYRIEVPSRSTVIDNYTGLVVLRNDPEEVVIRLLVSYADGLQATKTLDLGLRRGDIWVRGYLQSEVAVTWKVVRDSAEASTAYTGGIGASGDDASGNRYQLVSPTMTTKDTTNGGIEEPSAVTKSDFAIGSEVGGSGAAYPNDLTGTRNIVEQFFAAQAEHSYVAGR